MKLLYFAICRVASVRGLMPSLKDDSSWLKGTLFVSFVFSCANNRV